MAKTALGALVVVIAGLAGAAPLRAEPLTFGYGNARMGSDPPSAAITPATAPKLRVQWRTSVGGAINTQPLVVDGVRIRGRTRNLVVVGTERGDVVALDRESGSVVWRTRLGSRRIDATPYCQASPDNTYGITATPTIDTRGGRVYAVDAGGLAWALSLSGGRVITGWPVRVHPAGGAAFVWGGLTLSRGWLYVTIASLCDLGHYYGGIVAVNVNHPATSRSWQTTPGTGTYGGGIWGWGGVSVDDRSGDVYAATGNSSGTRGEGAGYAEAVVRLSSALAVKQSNHPLRGIGGATDRDFGTTPVLISAPRCPAQLVAINKDGELFLYNRGSIGAGPVQRIRVADGQPGAIPLIGLPAFDLATRTLVLVTPKALPQGIAGNVKAFVLTRACRLVPRWQALFDGPGIASAPTIAGGVLFIGAGIDGWLRAFDLNDGRLLWSTDVSQEPIYAAPAIAHGEVFTADFAGRVTAFGFGR